MTMTRVVLNVLLLSVFLYAWIIHDYFFDFYVESVQEDEYLEWATFFGFLLATAFFARAAYHRQKKNSQFPWFLYGLSIFCFLFAMEEISWGQRIIGYRPAAYFLENNFQQELNFHNVMPTYLRELTIQAIILGYGVVLPLVMFIPWVKNGVIALASLPHLPRSYPLSLQPSLFCSGIRGNSLANSSNSFLPSALRLWRWIKTPKTVFTSLIKGLNARRRHC